MKKIIPAILLLLSLSACNSLNPVINESPNNDLSQPSQSNGSINIVPAEPDLDTESVTPNNQDQPFAYKIYLIAIDDKGLNGQEIGCGDSVIGVEHKSEKPFTNTADSIKSALEELFSINTKDYGESGLTNTLVDSTFKVDSVDIDQNDKATVNISGNFSLGGVCDNPRVQAQIENTVSQFPNLKGYAIFVNNKTLSDSLSLQG